jgi:hypothetical protein
LERRWRKRLTAGTPASERAFSLLLLRRYLPGLLPSEVRERANPFTGGKEHAEERKIGERDRVTSGTMEGSSGLPAGNSRMVRWLVQGRGSRREK